MHSGSDKDPSEKRPQKEKPKRCRGRKPHRRTTTERNKSARKLGFLNVARGHGQEAALNLAHAELTTAQRTIDELRRERDDLRQQLLQRQPAPPLELTERPAPRLVWPTAANNAVAPALGAHAAAPARFLLEARPAPPEPRSPPAPGSPPRAGTESPRSPSATWDFPDEGL